MKFERNPRPINSLKKKREGDVKIEPSKPKLWEDRMVKIQAMQDWVIKNLESAFQKQAKYYNLRHRPLSFHLGDLVLMRNRNLSSKIKHTSAKRCPRFIGFYRIYNVISPTVYGLGDFRHVKIGKYSISDLKSFIPHEDE